MGVFNLNCSQQNYFVHNGVVSWNARKRGNVRRHSVLDRWSRTHANFGAP